MQAASSQVASRAQLTSCNAWRQGAVAQAVQILKQTPEGSCRGLLDSPEHTDSSQLASRVPLWPPAGPGEGKRGFQEADWEESVCSGESSRPLREPSGIYFRI